MSTETITPATYVETIPERYQNTYNRAIGGSRVSAVKAFCQHCQGYSEGTTRAIRECPTTWCPLWSVRPYQDKSKGDVDDGEEIENENEEGGEEVGQGVVVKSKRVPSHAFLESRKGRVRDPGRDERVRVLTEDILDALRMWNDNNGYMADKQSVLNIFRLKLKKPEPADSEWNAALNILISEGRIITEGVKRGRRYRRV